MTPILPAWNPPASSTLPPSCTPVPCTLPVSRDLGQNPRGEAINRNVGELLSPKVWEILGTQINTTLKPPTDDKREGRNFPHLDMKPVQIWEIKEPSEALAQVELCTPGVPRAFPATEQSPSDLSWPQPLRAIILMATYMFSSCLLTDWRHQVACLSSASHVQEGKCVIAWWLRELSVNAFGNRWKLQEIVGMEISGGSWRFYRGKYKQDQRHNLHVVGLIPSFVWSRHGLHKHCANRTRVTPAHGRFSVIAQLFFPDLGERKLTYQWRPRGTTSGRCAGMN